MLGFDGAIPTFDSNTQRDKFNKNVNELAGQFVRGLKLRLHSISY